MKGNAVWLNADGGHILSDPALIARIQALIDEHVISTPGGFTTLHRENGIYKIHVRLAAATGAQHFNIGDADDSFDQICPIVSSSSSSTAAATAGTSGAHFPGHSAVE